MLSTVPMDSSIPSTWSLGITKVRSVNPSSADEGKVSFTWEPAHVPLVVPLSDCVGTPPTSTRVLSAFVSCDNAGVSCDFIVVSCDITVESCDMVPTSVLSCSSPLLLGVSSSVSATYVSGEGGRPS